MRISHTLFFCIKNDLGISIFPYINMRSVLCKRQWKNYSPKKRKEVSEKMSEQRLNMPTKLKKKLSKSMRKGMKKYWNGLSLEKRKLHIAKMSKGMKNAWENADDDFGSRFGSVHIFNERIQFEHDTQRINTYSGVITESEMEEINA